MSPQPPTNRPPTVIEYPPESCRIPQNAPKFAQILEDGLNRWTGGGVEGGLMTVSGD